MSSDFPPVGSYHANAILGCFNYFITRTFPVSEQRKTKDDVGVEFFIETRIDSLVNFAAVCGIELRVPLFHLQLPDERFAHRSRRDNDRGRSETGGLQFSACCPGLAAAGYPR